MHQWFVVFNQEEYEVIRGSLYLINHGKRRHKGAFACIKSYWIF